jgi:mono/diheme cytochrome c family protein
VGLWGLLAVFFASPTGVTFSHDVAPILYRQCVACHRPGGVAPFSLIAYPEAAKRAALIATVTAKRYMPPWLPSEPAFEHPRHLTDS